MANSSLVPYSIRLRRKGETNRFLDLYNLDSISEWSSNENTEPLENFVEFLGRHLRLWHKQAFVHEEAERTLAVSDFAVSPREGFAEGVFRYGQFGTDADYLSIEDKTNVDIIQDSKTAVENPFYFYAQITKDDPEKGIIFLEKRGIKGIKTLFQDALWKALPDSLILEINPVSGSEDNPHYMSHFINEIKANRDFENKTTVDQSQQNRYLESIYERTVTPYKYSEFRRQQLVWKTVLLLSAAVTDTGELSSELTEEQKIMIRTALAVITGVTIGATVSPDAGVAIGVGAWSTSLLEGLYQNKNKK